RVLAGIRLLGHANLPLRILLRMSVTLLEQPPPTVPSELGPYRRADYAALPDEPRCELIHGRFYLSPSPVRLHQFLVTELWQVLQAVAGERGGQALVAPMDVHLADHTVAHPDVLYVSPQRREILQDWIEGAPDLVVEVLSPSTARMDRLLKLSRYAEAGVREYWLVDPAARTIEFYVNGGEHFVVHAPTGAIWKSPAVPGVELDIEGLWVAVERKFGSAAG
ncbi:MAG: Uma2 family endonuclease, partial [Chloroflexi bacterium]|nr:Uma2 family endonuclease [Chloroflexota bacterium]